MIARNSSFTYKGRAVDVKQVGRELGVRYVLEGSVRKAGSRVRITGQLVDTSTGAHLWAERFDGDLEDIFDLQDQVTASVVGAIAPKLEQAEIERAKRKPTESLDAYDYFLRGMAALYQWTREGTTKRCSFSTRPSNSTPISPPPMAWLRDATLQRKSVGWVTDRAHEIAETARLARRAGDLGKEDAVALFPAGLALALVVGDLDDGDALIDRALVVNPNLAAAWIFSGWVKVFLGEHEVAIEREARAMRLSPHDPQILLQAATAGAHFFAGRYAEALSWAQTAVREQSNFFIALCVAAASAALGGKPDEAREAMARVRQLNPALRTSNIDEILPFKRRQDLDLWTEGLRRAGLPE